MIKHVAILPHELKIGIKNHQICFAGNKRLKIYGLLGCASGKKMKKENRIFFKTENEALNEGYRPCGYCLKQKYTEWIYLTRS